MSFKLRAVDLHKPVAAWYAAYLQSPRWKNLRAELIAERGSTCEVCKERPVYSVHHNTYARLWCEFPDDFTLVCKECHKELHETYEIPFMAFIYTEDEDTVKYLVRKYSTSNHKPTKRQNTAATRQKENTQHVQTDED